MDTLKFDSIRPTIPNARTIQRLALDSLGEGAFENPYQIANPDDLRLVNYQLDDLNSHPELFTGVYIDGNLRGYMRIGDWMAADELPYATENEKPPLTEMQGVHVPELKLGIFGLAVSLGLEDISANMITDRLLHTATDIASDLQHVAVTIALHDMDRVQPVAKQQGFKFTGRIHEPLRRDGVLQRLYSKPLDT